MRAQVALRAAGAVELFVRMLGSPNQHEQETAAAAIWATAGHPDNSAALADSGAVPALVALLRKGHPEAKAALALKNLAANANNAVMIAQAGAIPPLVRMLTRRGGPRLGWPRSHPPRMRMPFPPHTHNTHSAEHAGRERPPRCERTSRRGGRRRVGSARA